MPIYIRDSSRDVLPFHPQPNNPAEELLQRFFEFYEDHFSRVLQKSIQQAYEKTSKTPRMRLSCFEVSPLISTFSEIDLSKPIEPQIRERFCVESEEVFPRDLFTKDNFITVMDHVRSMTDAKSKPVNLVMPYEIKGVVLPVGVECIRGTDVVVVDVFGSALSGKREMHVWYGGTQCLEQYKTAPEREVIKEKIKGEIDAIKEKIKDNFQKSINSAMTKEEWMKWLDVRNTVYQNKAYRSDGIDPYAHAVSSANNVITEALKISLAAASHFNLEAQLLYLCESVPQHVRYVHSEVVPQLPLFMLDIPDSLCPDAKVLVDVSSRKIGLISRELAVILADFLKDIEENAIPPGVETFADYVDSFKTPHKIPEKFKNLWFTEIQNVYGQDYERKEFGDGYRRFTFGHILPQVQQVEVLDVGDIKRRDPLNIYSDFEAGKIIVTARHPQEVFSISFDAGAVLKQFLEYLDQDGRAIKSFAEFLTNISRVSHNAGRCRSIWQEIAPIFHRRKFYDRRGVEVGLGTCSTSAPGLSGLTEEQFSQNTALRNMFLTLDNYNQQLELSIQVEREEANEKIRNASQKHLNGLAEGRPSQASGSGTAVFWSPPPEPRSDKAAREQSEVEDKLLESEITEMIMAYDGARPLTCDAVIGDECFAARLNRMAKTRPNDYENLVTFIKDLIQTRLAIFAP